MRYETPFERQEREVLVAVGLMRHHGIRPDLAKFPGERAPVFGRLVESGHLAWDREGTEAPGSVVLTIGGWYRLAASLRDEAYELRTENRTVGMGFIDEVADKLDRLADECSQRAFDRSQELSREIKDLLRDPPEHKEVI